MRADLEAVLADTASAVSAELAKFLPENQLHERRLFSAMRYSALRGGQRLRPMLVLSSAALFGVPRSKALRVAAAVELVHRYSLVHDDLPELDDAAIRHGRPSLHRKYDVATAILAGNAMLTMAFEILSHPDTARDPGVRAELVHQLARAAGAPGMVGGQMLDIIGETESFNAATLARMQRLKTGALIGFSCEAGAIMRRVGESQRNALCAYAHDLGIALQIVEDLQDHLVQEKRGTSLGAETQPENKGQTGDAMASKTTFVSIMGVERARAQANLLSEQAIRHLQVFENGADIFRDIAKFIVGPLFRPTPSALQDNQVKKEGEALDQSE